MLLKPFQRFNHDPAESMILPAFHQPRTAAILAAYDSRLRTAPLTSLNAKTHRDNLPVQTNPPSRLLCIPPTPDRGHPGRLPLATTDGPLTWIVARSIPRPGSPSQKRESAAMPQSVGKAVQ